MISTLIAAGAFALKWFGGGAGIIGLVSAVLRIPFVSGLVSAIPVVGPVITEVAKVVLGWVDTAVRFLVSASLALMEAVSGRPIIAIPIILALYGQHFYLENWKYRRWTPPASVASTPAPAAEREPEPRPRSILDGVFGPLDRKSVV